LHPGMSVNLLNRWPLSGIKLYHFLDKVFELFREVIHLALFILAVGTPEYVKSVCGDTSVERVDWLSGSKRWMLSHHNKKDNCRGK